MFYWMESVQSYDEGGWKYKDELARFVERGMQGTSFIDAVSGIVNRGCHNPVSSYVVFSLVMFWATSHYHSIPFLTIAVWDRCRGRRS